MLSRTPVSFWLRLPMGELALWARDLEELLKEQRENP